MPETRANIPLGLATGDSKSVANDNIIILRSGQITLPLQMRLVHATIGTPIDYETSNEINKDTCCGSYAWFCRGSGVAESALKDILDSGVLKVGTTGDWNPMTVKDPATNSYKGYDIDVMTELAKDMDVELEFIATDWKTLVNGVVGGNYHLTGSASISAARMKACLLYTSPSPRDQRGSRMPSSA